MLPPEHLGEINKRLKPVSRTITIPEDHPAAKELVELMNFLATEMHVGGVSAKRPGDPGNVDVMLNALRRAGYAKEVNRAVAEIEAQGRNDAIAKGMRVMGVLLQAPGFREVAKRAEEHLHERIPQQIERERDQAE